MTRTQSLLEGDRMSMVRSIALIFLGEFAQRGMRTQVVLPDLDDRFFVSLFGRFVSAPKSRFRWWASQLNIEQMERALLDLRQASGEKLLMPTGVRLRESAARDSCIALSCDRGGATPDHVADVLALLLLKLPQGSYMAPTQERPLIDLINDEEQARVLELIAADTWPDRWRGREVRGNMLIPQVIAVGIMRSILGGELYA
jgi:hypothetical protein